MATNGKQRFVTCAVAAIAVAAVLAAPNGMAGTLTVAPGQRIQAVIDAAQDGDEIVVQPAIYREAIDFKGKDIWLRSLGGAAVTVIDATGLGTSAVTFRTGEPPTARLDGFTITGGSGRLDVTGHDFGGGGIHTGYGAAPTIADCVISHNSVRHPSLPTSGGGVMASRHGFALFQRG